MKSELPTKSTKAPTATYGNFSAYKLGTGIRFQTTENNKKRLIKEVEVPQQIVQYLKQQLGVKPPAPTHFDQATSPEKQQEAVKNRVLEDEALSREDFEAVEALASVQAVLPPVPEQPVAVEVSAPQTMSENIKVNSDNTLSPIEADKPSMFQTDVPDEFMLHGASLEDLARAMYDRFGVYTVFLHQYPEAGDISPLTGEGMPNYDRGIAYQAARRAFEQGRLVNRDYASIRAEADASRAAHEEYQNRVPLPHQEPTIEEARQRNDFAYRTSVRGGNENPNGIRKVYSEDDGELLVEPPLNVAPGREIIRPDW